ncbi:MAG: SDR family NAD(P)-dependent oxidoreductase [Gammaproteobacteria bacterium]|nr:SDR family NAD(P)-dependent oxidoreductase [Gammaproteobacteria bacterium]
MVKKTPACEGKVAIITGASRGIGVGIAQRLACEGAKVALLARSLRADDTRIPGSLEETVDLISAAGGEALPLVVNLTDPEQDYAQVVQKVENAFGRVDILVNNAAANFYHSFEDTSYKRMHLITEANFLAPLKLIQAALPAMLRRGEGWVINISSAASRLPRVIDPGDATRTVPMMYGATKAAFDRATAGLAQEYFQRHIAFNSLAPQASVATPAQQQYYPDMPAEVIEPLDTMAEAVHLLCSRPPQSLTGKVTRSLNLICELGEPVYALDGQTLLGGWQPAEISPQRLTDPHTLTT